MSLPSYALNQTSFPQMYEQWLVGPLFRLWAEITVEAIRCLQAIVSSTLHAEREWWRALRRNGSVMLTSNCSPSMNGMAFVGMSGAGKTMSDDERKAVVEAITHDSEPVLQSYSDASDWLSSSPPTLPARG